MPIPFLNSIKLNKNQVEDFCVFNYSGDPTLSSGADFGYLWLNTSATPKVLKFWDGTNYRTLIDSTTISSSTAGTANDLSGGVAGSLPYQQGVGDTTFLGIGTADQVLTVNSGATAPQWLSQSSLSVGSATNKTGGNLGDILVQSGSGTTGFLNVGTAGQVITSNGASPQYVNQSTLSVGSATTATTATNVAGGANGSILVQSGAGTTGQLAIGASGYILTSNGTTPGWSASIPSTSVSGLAASATTDTTNASNISSGTLGLARLSLASGQFYVGDGSNNPAATAKSSIPLSGFGAAGADVAMGGFKITGLADPSAATDAATRGYVDSVAQGLDVKASCLVATTTDITLASPGAVTIDGIYSATDFTSGTTRILVKDQSAPAENGIYIWQGPSSAMTRSADANTWDELVGAFTFIERGTANADSGWVCTSNAGGTLGTTAVTFVKFSQAGSYTAGNGIVQSGTSFNFAQSTPYTAGQIPFASSTTAMGFNANLHWDNANNRLGINDASPQSSLHVALPESERLIVEGYFTPGDSKTGLLFGTSQTDRRAAIDVGIVSGGSGYLTFSTSSAASVSALTERLRIGNDGVCTWSNVGGVVSNAMVLNGTGLGIGASPSTNLHVYGAAPRAMIENSANNGIYLRLKRPNKEYIVALDINNNGGNDFTIWDNTAAASRLTIDNTGNVGIGTATPAASLQVGTRSTSILSNNSTILTAGGASASAGTTVAATFANTVAAAVGNEAQITFTPASNYSATGAIGTAITSTANGESALKFYTYHSSVTGLTERLRIASDGVCTWSNVVNAGTAMTLNATGLGLGVTPSAWVGYGLPIIELPNYGTIVTQGENATIGANWFYSSGFKYKASASASYYNQAAGAHKWFTAPSGTAGNAITFTQAMTLFSNGALSLGTASDALSQPGNVYLHGDSGSGKGATIAFGQAGAVLGCIGQLARIVGGGTSQDIFIQSQGTSNNVGINAYPSGAVIYFQTQGTERLRIKSTGQLNLTGLASDPAGAAGDVYYNSTAKALKLYATDWKTLPRKAVVQGGAGTGTTIAVAHNLNTNNVSVTVLRTTDNVVVFTDVAITDADTVTITFASSVTKADYTITVIG